MANPELDRVQKSRRIKDYLSRRRFPTVFKTKAKFEKIIKTLRLGETINLIPPKDFEGATYKLTLQFKSHAELQEMRSKLDTIIRNRDLQDFWG